MGQQWDQGRNQKIPWDKWKWEHSNQTNNSNLWNKAKAVLIGKFIAMQAYFKKQEKSQSIITAKWTKKRRTIQLVK